MKSSFAWEAEDDKGNLRLGTVKAKSFKKALEYVECILKHHHNFTILSEIKLECIK